MPNPNRKDGRHIPTTRAGRIQQAEEHAARRQVHREKLWGKIDLLLDLIKVGCPADCNVHVEHEVPTSGNDLRNISIAYGILLDKYRLETGERDSGGADIDLFLEKMGDTPPPSQRAKQVSGSAKKVTKKVLKSAGLS